MERTPTNVSGADSNPGSNSRPVKTGFGDVLGETWELYKKNFVLYSTIFVVPAVLVMVMQQFVQPFAIQSILGNMSTDEAGKQLMQFGGPMVTAILVIIGIITLNSIINFVVYGAMLHASSKVENGVASVGESFSFSLSRFVNGMWLSLRIFFYTLAWIAFLIIAALVGMTVAAVISSGGIGTGENFSEGAIIMQSLGGFALIGILALVVVMIVSIIRSLRVTFAFPIFFSDEKVTPKEALDKSIFMSKGLSGTVFLNYFLLGILFAVLGGVYAVVVGQIVVSVMPQQSAFSPSLGSISQVETQFNQIMEVVTLPVIIFAGSIGVIFQYVFMKKASEEKMMELK